jgi:hypothetical protein
MSRRAATLRRRQAEAEKLDAAITANLRALGLTYQKSVRK